MHVRDVDEWLMEHILDFPCSQCGRMSLVVVPFRDKIEGLIVSHGECSYCFLRVVLPGESFNSFVSKHCVGANVMGTKSMQEV